jgi:hypothetical protein
MRGGGNGERKMTGAPCFISAHRAPNYKIGFLHLWLLLLRNHLRPNNTEPLINN